MAITRTERDARTAILVESLLTDYGCVVQSELTVDGFYNVTANVDDGTFKAGSADFGTAVANVFDLVRDYASEKAA